jgi:glycerol-3-phosphate dehydrogenase subunit C
MKEITPLPDRCIACTTCTVVCPVARATPDFPGPRMLGPAHERFRLLGIGEDESLHYCSNCKNCDISCPCDVPVSSFIMRAKAEAAREKRPVPRDWFLAHGELLARWLRFFPAGLKNFGLSFGPARMILQWIGIARKSPIPCFASKTFREHFASLKQAQGLPRKVVFFPGCYVDIYDPDSGLDMVAVLNRAGYEVIVPDDFVCCGLPLVANGFWEDARVNARKNLKALSRWKAEGCRVITGCPSCALMFKEDYAQYFPDLLPGAVSPALADACEFLLEAMDRGELRPPAKGSGKQEVLYHAPCHLRAQGLGLPGLALLREIPGLNAVNADAGCCGISGSYGFKSEKYAISLRVGAKLFETIRRSPARVCASECGTCRVQMRHGGGKETVHPITLLRRCLDGKPVCQETGK